MRTTCAASSSDWPAACRDEDPLRRPARALDLHGVRIDQPRAPSVQLDAGALETSGEAFPIVESVDSGVSTASADDPLHVATTEYLSIVNPNSVTALP